MDCTITYFLFLLCSTENFYIFFITHDLKNIEIKQGLLELTINIKYYYYFILYY